jgi:hypothetical protein
MLAESGIVMTTLSSDCPEIFTITCQALQHDRWQGSRHWIDSNLPTRPKRGAPGLAARKVRVKNTVGAHPARECLAPLGRNQSHRAQGALLLGAGDELVTAG